MTNLYIDIETVPDYTSDEYHRLSAQLESGEITKSSDPATYWKLKRGALSPFEGRVVFIKYQISENGILHALKEWDTSEADILKKIYNVIADLQHGANTGMRIVGHNITKFDLPFLYERMCKHDISTRSNLYYKLCMRPLIVDFLLCHLELNKMTAKGLKHDILAHAYGLPTKATQGDSEIKHYFNKEYDKIIEYSKREFIYPKLYSIIDKDGIISREKLEESKLWYDKLHADDKRSF